MSVKNSYQFFPREPEYEIDANVVPVEANERIARFLANKQRVGHVAFLNRKGM